MTESKRGGQAAIGIIGGSGLYDIEGLERVSLPTWAGAQAQPQQHQLSRQYLCVEIARGDASDFGQRRRQHEGIHPSR